jgi:glucuronate isomerase
MEAFEKAANSEFAPEQLKFCTTWQPKKVFFNPSWWFFEVKKNLKKQIRAIIPN